LREKCDVEPITEGWNALCYDAAGSCRSSKDGGAEGDAGVLRIGKDTLTVRQACVELGAAKGNLGGSADSARVAQLLESHVVPQLLILQEAETKGMVSAIAAELRGRSEEKLVEIMLAKELSRARTITIDDEKARQFYETHPEWFRTAAEITVQEILVAEAELALELKARIHAGEKMSELADQHTKRQTSEGKGGVFHFHSIESIRFGELARRAREAPIGELVGPVQVEEGYSVFKVLSKERKQLAWDKKQKLRAKLMLESAQKDSIRVAFVHELREKYSANVQVFDPVLKAMSRLEKTEN
jgi:parvulin-like peptidyl-prolyl isomerase